MTTPLADLVRRHSPPAFLLLLLVLGALASAYQVQLPLFYCGLLGAGEDIHYLSAAVGVQSLLFLAAGHRLARTAYRATQWACLPVLALLGYQLSAQHARIFLLLATAMAAYLALRALLDRRELRGRRGFATHWPEACAFVVLAILIESGLALVVLYTRGLLLTDQLLWVLWPVALGLAWLLTRYVAAWPRFTLDRAPPLLLLVMILARAKWPDGAFDTLLYKATTPLMIADWRTALTGLPDHTLLGTNLLEIISSQLRILDPSYAPSLVASFSFAALWLLTTPLVSMLRRVAWLVGEPKAASLAGRTAVLLAVSISEPLLAAGTSYQEPALSLLMAAGLIAGPVGWVMLAAAASVKVTALFFVPWLLLLRAFTVDRKFWRFLWGKLRALVARRFGSMPQPLHRQKPGTAIAWWALSLALAALLFGGQLARNQGLSGRLLAPSEALAGLTDPKGQVLSHIGRDAVFDVVRERSLADSVATNAIHIATLNLWIRPDDLGFHTLPSSRTLLAGLFAVLLAIAAFKRQALRHLLVLGGFFAVSVILFWHFFSQGRHFAPASLTAAIWVGLMVAGVLRISSRGWQIPLALGVAALAVGDQVVGNYINNGWECRRDWGMPAAALRYDQPKNALDERLRELAAEYRSKQQPSPNPRIIPSIWCDTRIDAKPYLGLHYTFSYPSQRLAERQVNADPLRILQLPRAALVLCLPQNRESMIPRHLLKDYDQDSVVEGTEIWVSRALKTGRPAESLAGRSFPRAPWLVEERLVHDLVAAWETGKLDREAKIDSPTGRAALKLKFGESEAGVLIAPHALRFEQLELQPEDRIELEHALPFHNSDGLEVKLRVLLNGQVIAMGEFAVPPRKSEQAPLGWRKFKLRLPSYPSRASVVGTIELSTHSASGNIAGDWVAVRKLQVIRTIK